MKLFRKVVTFLVIFSFLVSSCGNPIPVNTRFSGSHLNSEEDGIDPNDLDRDGVSVNDDLCDSTPFGETVGDDGCPAADLDQDGVPDARDLCPGTPYLQAIPKQ